MCFVSVIGKVSTLFLLSSWSLCCYRKEGCQNVYSEANRADRIKNAAAKKREAAEALVTARDIGEGPLFSVQ